jgi:predicted nucleic acid-binding Zn ribbon protein
MPLYEYECSDGHVTERVKSIKVSDQERDTDKCEVCGKPSKLRVSRPNPPILVGRGFHANDYGAPTKG